MTIREAINKATIMLKSNNIELPKLKARLLLQYVLGKNRQYLIVYDTKILSQEYKKRYFDYINDMIKGTPLQHITHMQEFMNMNFFVDENVLIPRPDTEILVEEVIKIAQKMRQPQILDLCTGSGAIGISIAKYINESTVYAVDISKKALYVAKLNARSNGVVDRINFIESDLFENIPNIKFDIIVSNPPYIRKDVIKLLDKEVRKEPKIALDGGKDGLDFYKKITKSAYEYLRYNGYLCYEIGYDQKIDVIEIIENERKYVNTYSKRDLYGNDRIIITKLGG